jgi:hypothetical protein
VILSYAAVTALEKNSPIISDLPIKENTETLLEASRAVGLEINAEKTKYMIVSRHPNSGQNQKIRIANECGKIQIFGDDTSKSE